LVVFKEARAKDLKKCGPTPDRRFIAEESTLMEFVWIFGCPLAVFCLFTNQTSGNETHEKCFYNTPFLVAVMFYGLCVQILISKPRNMEELKRRIKEEIVAIPEQMARPVMENLRERLEQCLRNGG
jgi:hypothetical protein